MAHLGFATGVRTAVDPMRLTSFMDRPATRSYRHTGGVGASAGSYIGVGAGAPYAEAEPSYGASTIGASTHLHPRPQDAFDKFAEGSARVVIPEKHATAGLFDNVPRQRLRRKVKTEASELVDGDADDSDGDDAAKEVRADPDADSVVLERPRFEGGQLRQPRVVRRADLHDVKPVQGLGLPSQRRAEMNKVVDHERAKKAMRKARLDKQRTEDLMRNRHPGGVLTMDSPEASDTRVYTDMASTLRAKRAAAADHEAKRQAHIAEWTSGRTRRGYDVIGHTDAPASGADAVVFQRKKIVGKHEDTKVRLFLRKPVVKDHSRRTQRLRNEETKGRNYDIISGKQLPVVGPNTGTVIEHKRQAHPSIISTTRFTDR